MRIADLFARRVDLPKSKPVYASLRVESLEDRCLLSGNPVGLTVSPAWFQDCDGSASPDHAGVAGWSSASLGNQPPSTIAQGNQYDWIVQFRSGAVAGMSSPASTFSLLAGSGSELQVLRGLGLVGEVLVRSEGASTATVASFLAHDGNVAEYELDSAHQFTSAVPNDPMFPQLWGLNNTGQSGGQPHADINATDAWNISTGSRNVVVAVLDTGVDYTDSDLAPNIWTNPLDMAANGWNGDGFAGDVHGYDFYDNNGNPMDTNGHGTHVAGIIGADGDNGLGVTGVDWSVSIMALKFLGPSGAGYTSDAIRAINYATMMRSRYGVNVRVINASWGGTIASAALENAIQAAGNAGILFVAAAGNSSQTSDVDPQYPAAYQLPNMLSVAATDSNDNLAWFSNYGPNSVNLAAPGVGIVSTVPGNRYASLSGTSMATPYVSGVAALAWSVDPDATVAQVRNAILEGVDPLASLQGKVTSGGRLDAFKTLSLLTGSTQSGSSHSTLTLKAIANQTVPAQQGSLAVTLLASTSSANPVRFSATTSASANDVGLSLAGNVLTIRLRSGYVGSFGVVVTAIAGSTSSSQSFQVSVPSPPLALEPIGNQTMVASQGTLAVPLQATGGAGAGLTYGAQVIAPDPLAEEAYYLDQQLGLRFMGSYYQNFRGAQERYLLGNQQSWYFILPDGELHRYTGSIASSPLVADLSPAYYADPSLLYNAQMPANQAQPGNVALRMNGSVLSITPRAGFTGTIAICATVSNGTTTAQSTFYVTMNNGPATAQAIRIAVIDSALVHLGGTP